MEHDHAVYLERIRTGDLTTVVGCLREWAAVESVPAQDEFDLILTRLEAMTATLTQEEVNALPIGSVIVMHHKDHEPVPHPGNTWFRIERGWINSYGSEVPARDDWPHVGQLGGASAVTAVFRAEGGRDG